MGSITLTKETNIKICAKELVFEIFETGDFYTEFFEEWANLSFEKFIIDIASILLALDSEDKNVSAKHIRNMRSYITSSSECNFIEVFMEFSKKLKEMLNTHKEP